jgi:hypothetical protein
MPAPFDVTDQAVLTDLITRPLTTQYEDNPRLGDVLMPFKNLAARSAKFRTREALAFGIGPFRAPDATPALYKGNSTWREETISLTLQEEMERISEETYLQLSSPDETVRRAAGLEIIERAQILAIRNERRTEAMRWEALLTGELVVTYPGGQSFIIDYQYDSDQLIDVSTSWETLATADPITDMRDASKLIAGKVGYYGVKYYMSSDTYDLLVRNTKVKNLLTATNRSMLLATRQDLQVLLPENSDIVLYDNGYRDAGAGSDRGLPNSLTRYLPYGKVLVSTETTLEGVNVAETLDGQVVVNSGLNQLDVRQGAQAEVIVEPLSHNYIMRYATARVPRMIYPGCFAVLNVLGA